MEKPILVEVFADNGEFSHWKLVNVETGETIWEEPEDGVDSHEIQRLKSLISKRDELIFSMVRSTHSYQSFMLNENMDIDELRKKFNTIELMKNEEAQNRVKILSNEIK